MKKSLLTWFVQDSAVQSEMYIGNFPSTQTFELSLSVVNNYLGIEPISDVVSGRLMLAFKDYEDALLLNHFQIMFDGSYNAPLEIIGNRAYATIPRTLSGDYSNPRDCTLDIKININQELAVKSDLKQLILDII